MRKKLIEVALPLEAINIESAREKSIHSARASLDASSLVGKATFGGLSGSVMGFFGVRLLKREDLKADWKPESDTRMPVWEITQYLIRTLDQDGETGAAELLAKLGSKANLARDLAYWLYSLCDRKGWTQEGITYNSLVTSWPEITRLANEYKPSPEQMTLSL
jgi:adenine-specific DNA methylase